MLKLSEQPEYLKAIPALVAKDYVGARSNLYALLDRIEHECDSRQIPYLQTLLARVEAGDNNPFGALNYFDQAVKTAPHLHTQLLCIKGLAWYFPEKARASLAEAERVFKNDWRGAADDMSADWYAQQIHELRVRLADG